MTRTLKKFLVVLLSLSTVLCAAVMLAAFAPSGSAFAAAVSSEPDENGVSFSYEIVSSPLNGEYYFADESIDIEINVIVPSEVTLEGVTLYWYETEPDGQDMSVEDVTQPCKIQIDVTYAMAEQGSVTLTIKLGYTLNDQLYQISETVSQIPTGLPKPVITNVSALRKQGELSVSFKSDVAGTYACVVLEDGQTLPDDWS